MKFHIQETNLFLHPFMIMEVLLEQQLSSQ